MRPQLSALGKINPEIRAVSENIKKAKEDINKLNAYRADLEEASKKFSEANLKVKSRDEVSFILEYIAYVASETGVKIDQMPTEYLTDGALLCFLREQDWANTLAIAHHAHFDGAILAWRAGIRPKFWGCTLSMARALYPHESASLGKLAEHLGLPHAAVVNGIAPQEGEATINVELEGGMDEISKIRLPAMLSIQTGINEPRYVSIMGMGLKLTNAQWKRI